MNYLIIAYKPSSKDYCRGCLMASYSSGYAYINTTDRNKALRFIADKMKYECDTGEASYGFDVFIDGKTCGGNGETDADLYTDEDNGIMHEADILAKKELEEGLTLRRQREAEKARLEKEKAAREKEACDRRDYERLKVKFEGEANV